MSQPWAEYKPLDRVSSEPSLIDSPGWKARLVIQRDAVTVERKRRLMVCQFTHFALSLKATVHFAGFRDGCRCITACAIVCMGFCRSHV